MLSKLWYSQFPEWARPEHPIMRSILGSTHGISRRRWLIRWIVVILLAVAAVGGTIVLQDEFSIRELLYGPLVIAQIMAIIVALTLTANTVSTEEQRGTWDTLKLTLIGVPLTLRARWIAVFHQLKWLLGLIILGRLAFTGMLLYDITDFQGRALDLYISGIAPEVSLDVTILIMVAFMTAFIMQPVIAVALSAALGIVLAVLIRSRALVFVLMLLLIGIYLGLVFAGITLGQDIILDRTETLLQEEVDATEGWTAITLMLLGGDMGIEMTQLETQGQVWADFEYGIFMGAGYLVTVMLLGIIANGLVLVASRQAAKPSKV